MKCQLCDGKGEYMHAIGGYRPCEHCKGTGKIVQTNEEWLEQASTEEKAKLLSKLCKFIYNCGKKGSIPKFMYEEDFFQWLKEKHHE